MRWVGAAALMGGLALAPVATLAQDDTTGPGIAGAPVALHDGSCAAPIVEPEFEIGQLQIEPYSEVVDEFYRDALDEDVPADVRVPTGVPLVDEDLEDDGVLDDEEDLDDDGVIDAGWDLDEDGVLDEDELLDDADIGVVLADLPTVYKVEEEVDATFEEIFGVDEDTEDEAEDDDALDDPGIIAVHASSADFGTIIACGELTSPQWEDESDVVVGIRPMGESGVYGFAVFQRDTGNVPVFGENTTGVTVYLFENLATQRSDRMATPEATPEA
jgi:hypothetical protein